MVQQYRHHHHRHPCGLFDFFSRLDTRRRARDVSSLKLTTSSCINTPRRMGATPETVPYGFERFVQFNESIKSAAQHGMAWGSPSWFWMGQPPLSIAIPFASFVWASQTRDPGADNNRSPSPTSPQRDQHKPPAGSRFHLSAIRPRTSNPSNT